MSKPTTPRAPQAEIGVGTVLGSWELVAELGAGAMGRVYRARHARLGREVAIKVLNPEHAARRDVVERFFREARVANGIDHPHIVEVTDFVEAPGAAYLVMELLEGKSLRDLTAARGEGDPTIARLVALLGQVGDALHAAHEKGVIHRDLKPDNVFVAERDGREFAKVLDFGVAKLGGSAEPRRDHRRDDPRDAALHGARAGARAGGRPPHRRLGGRRRPPRAPRRRRAVQGAQLRGARHGDQGAAPRPDARAHAGRRADPGRPRRRSWRAASRSGRRTASPRWRSSPWRSAGGAARRRPRPGACASPASPSPPWRSPAAPPWRCGSGCRSGSRERWRRPGARCASASTSDDLDAGPARRAKAAAPPRALDAPRAGRATAPARPATRPTVELLLRSTPPGARVVRLDTGERLGTTPLQGGRPAQGGVALGRDDARRVPKVKFEVDLRRDTTANVAFERASRRTSRRR